MKKRITVISGHYGSGKSEISVNLAILKKVNVIVDLDIVNPYFRSREIKQILNEFKIEMISSPLEKSLGSDLPYLSARIFAPFYNQDIKAIYDLGGNPIGAKVFRQFEDLDKDEINHLVAINVFREETETVDDIVAMIKAIEGASGLRVTGLINNSNLLNLTTFEDILKGQEIIEKVAEILKLKIEYTTVKKEIKIAEKALLGEVIYLTLYLRKYWL